MAIDAPSRTRGFYTRAMDVSNQIQRFATAAFDPSPKVMFFDPKTDFENGIANHNMCARTHRFFPAFDDLLIPFLFAV